MSDKIDPSSYEKEEEIRSTALNLVNEIENAVISLEEQEALKQEILPKKSDKCLTIAADGIEMMESPSPKPVRSTGQGALQTIVECDNSPLNSSFLVSMQSESAEKKSSTNEVLSDQVDHDIRRESAANSLVDEAPSSPGSPERTKRPQLSRTQTLPNPKTSQFGIKFTKKKKNSINKTTEESAPNEQNKPGKPFSAVFKSFKKSITKNRFSKGEQTRSSIPQKSSNSRPSPRIVSSMVITPTECKPNEETNETNGEQLTPITQKRRLIEEITDDLLIAMPSSPSISIDSFPEEQMAITPVDASVDFASNHEEQTLTLTNPVQSEIVLETAITPVSLDKPVHAALMRMMTEEQPIDFPSGELQINVDGQLSREVGTAGRPQTHSVNYPPPRPRAPPNVLRRMQTLSPQASRPESYISANESYRVSSPPISLAPNTSDYNTASLDRRKIYRSKTETSTLKRSTIARPINRNSTIYRPLSTIESSTNVDKRKPPIVVFERSEAIAWPPKAFWKRESKTLAHEHEKTISEVPGHPQLSMSNGPILSNLYPCQPVSSIRGLDRTSITLLKTSHQAPCGRLLKTAIHQNTVQRLQDKLLNHSMEHGLILPILSSRLENEKRLFCVENEDISLNESQRSILLLHSFSKSLQLQPEIVKNVEGAPLGTVNVLSRDCMQNYITASMHVRESEMHGECAAFHCITSDPLAVGWSHLGSPLDWPAIQILLDPATETHFALLPNINYELGSVIYPDVTLDCMLVNWLDIGSTIHLTEAMNTFESKQTDIEFLHPTSAVITLYELLQRSDESTNFPNSLLLCFGLAVLLSLDYCQKQIDYFSSQHPSMTIAIDYNPRHVLLMAAPANCLPIFRLQSPLPPSPTITEVENGSHYLHQLISSFGLKSCSIDEAIKEVIENLTQFSSAHLNVEVLLPNLMKAIVPPDWMALSICRMSLV